MAVRKAVAQLNRVYAQIGFERTNLALLIRPWYRIRNTETDDNPDIEDYLGRRPAVVYRKGRNAYSCCCCATISRARTITAQ
jgi:outer membrane phospholipase A